MKIRRTIIAATILGLAATLGASTLAEARSGCAGVVRGLSGRYNPATGAGFLAVRAGPRTAAAQTGELFNGDRVEIFGRRGNWYRVVSDSVDGWASVRFIRNSCGY